MNNKKCIYCDEVKPFTREHVFPAGMGGDDPKYVLEDLVCGDCNTKVFSPLELQLMRNSPFALWRIMEQPIGRNRGKKSEEPKLYHDRCIYIDDAGMRIEAQIMAGMKPLTLPQIQICGDDVYVSAENLSDLDKFLLELRATLVDNFYLIRKIFNENSSSYEMSECVWNGNDYSEGSTEISLKPAGGIWLATFNDSDTTEWKKVYKRHQGQINVLVADKKDALSVLSGVRRTLPSLIENKSRQEKVVDKPLINVNTTMQVRSMHRAIAKIGVNFSCHEYGDEFVRSQEFGKIKNIILSGKEEVPAYNLPELAEAFSLEKRKVHLIILFSIKDIDSYTLVFIIRLYGGGFQMIKLATGIRSEPKKVAFIVDYVENKIDRLDFYDYLHSLFLSNHSSLN